MAIFNFFTIFKLIVIGILLLTQYYCFRKFVRPSKSGAPFGPLARTATVVFVIMNIPLVALLFWAPKLLGLSRVTLYSLIYPFYVWHFAFFMAGLVYLIAGIIRLPYGTMRWVARRIRTMRYKRSNESTPPPLPGDEGRRLFLRRGGMVVLGAAFSGSLYGAIRKDAFETTTITMSIANLPEAFEGFSIGLVSDIHSSVFMTKEMMVRYADAVNALGTDLITVTGDFVNGQVDEVYPLAEAFERLRAPSGVFGVLGNHDYYSRGVEEVARRVEECGIRLLINTNVRVERGGSAIALLGSDDIGSVARAELAFDHALRGVENALPKILMCHRPYYFDNAAVRGIDLVLSGHTHGGQIVLGRFNDNTIAPARIASKYVAGRYEIGASQMYVSRGIGTVGVPMRINCPPELTKIILTRG